MRLPSPLRIFLMASSWWHYSATAYGGGDNLAQEYCSTDNTGLEYSPYQSIYMSNGKCFDTCKDAYAFAVVQYNTCWCSNHIPKEQQDVGDCNQQCPGFPAEQCGNSNEDLFGYIALFKTPLGTAGAGATSSTQAASTQVPAQTTTLAPVTTTSPTTVVSKVTTTQVQIHQVTTTQPPNTEVVTSYDTTTVIPSTPTSTTTPTSPSSSLSSSTSSLYSTSPPPTLQTTTRVITKSGSVVTQTFTQKAIVLGGGSTQAPDSITVQRQPLSIGAIAGVVIGSLIGIAALLIAAFFLWRRKKNSDSERGSVLSSGVDRQPPKRNLSMLSKTGLLARNRPQSMAEVHDDESNPYGTGSTSVRHSMMLGAGATVEGVSPVSPLGSSSQDNLSARRSSRPLVYDQRLNPSALFAHADENSSRVSIQDQTDYSRPLGVANPDFRPSFDSR